MPSSAEWHKLQFWKDLARWVATWRGGAGGPNFGDIFRASSRNTTEREMWCVLPRIGFVFDSLIEEKLWRWYYVYIAMGGAEL